MNYSYFHFVDKQTGAGTGLYTLLKVRQLERPVWGLSPAGWSILRRAGDTGREGGVVWFWNNFLAQKGLGKEQ